MMIFHSYVSLPEGKSLTLRSHLIIFGPVDLAIFQAPNMAESSYYLEGAAYSIIFPLYPT